MYSISEYAVAVKLVSCCLEIYKPKVEQAAVETEDVVLEAVETMEEISPEIVERFDEIVSVVETETL